MAFLHLLEHIRNPICNSFFSVITLLGDETCFMILALVVFWCVSKRQGYFLFAVGFVGTTINQFLKLWFRIPRPWVLDPDFTIVESARNAATGYSFPSGHTQNIVGTLGGIALCNRRKWLRRLCAVLIVLVPFSRMYLGVHTPLDVGVSIAIAAVLLGLLYPLFGNDITYRYSLFWVLCGLMVLGILYTVFVLCYHFPADIDPNNLASGTKNAYTIVGVGAGLMLSFLADVNFLHFQEKAPLLGQIGKLLLGLAGMIGLRVLLKAPLLALCGGHQIATAIRYFFMVCFAGIVWPMSFPFWQRIGK